MEFRLKENLQMLLKSRNLKASDLARQSGVSPSVISEWMAGRRPRGIENLSRLAEELGLPLDELCFGRPEPRETRRISSSPGVIGKDVFPMFLPINESGMLELQIRWTTLRKKSGDK